MRCSLSRGFGILFAISLAACSGSSGGSESSPNTPFDAHIINDTGGGADGRLFGRVAALALEDDHGQMSSNLAIGNPEFVLSDPAGATFGVEIADFGPGKFVAVHVSFLPNTLKLQKGMGTPVDVALVGGSIKAPFTSPLEVDTLGAYRIELRHKTIVDIKTDSQGKLFWQPDMVADASGPVLLRDAAIEIVSVDVNAGTAVGLIGSLTNIRTTLSFLSNAVLVIGDDEESVTGFLGALQAKDAIRVFGVIDNASNTKVAYAERVDDLDPGHGRGRKNKVRGTITGLDTGTSIAQLEVQEIRIGGRDLPKVRPVTLSVDCSEAKIKYVPRYGRHNGHLRSSALATGMFVEVEWHGAAVNQQVLAHKVNIRSDGRFDFLDKIAGVVGAVDTQAKTITLKKPDGRQFFFGKESYESLKIILGTDTLLVENNAGTASELALADVKIGEDVWILGRKQTGAEVAAMLVVVVRTSD